MKAVVFLAVSSVAVMVVMVGQVVRQEMNRNSLRALGQDTLMRIADKEKTIEGLKIELKSLKPNQASVAKAIGELKVKKDAIQKELKVLRERVNKCKADRTLAEKKKAEIVANGLTKKNAHEQAKLEAKKAIEGFKQKNLDRDKIICAIVDTSNAEARKLCGL